MRRNKKGSLAELPVVLFVLLVMFFFPLLDLAFLATGASVIYLVNLQTAIRASSQPRYADALTAVFDEATRLNTSGLANFAKLVPTNGYRSCGTELSIIATNVTSGASTVSGANVPLPPPVDTVSNVYEYRTVSTYAVGPFVSMAKVPFITDVPGLGKPAVLTFTNHRSVEHPEGLSSLVPSLTLSGGTSSVNLSTVTGLDSPGTLTDTSGSGWNYPNIYTQIQQAGETVIDQDVLIVQANNPNWTPTNLAISTGDKVWIDYRASGSWSVGHAASSVTTANGMNQNNNTNLPIGSMIGKMSNPGTMFFLGQQKWNYTPPGSGQLSLAMNDSTYGPATPAAPFDYSNNSGYMTVRVIVAR